jgi:hypothetical protein
VSLTKELLFTEDLGKGFFQCSGLVYHASSHGYHPGKDPENQRIAVRIIVQQFGVHAPLIIENYNLPQPPGAGISTIQPQAHPVSEQKGQCWTIS